MDQHKEQREEEHHSKESAGQHKEEEKDGEEQDNSEEPMEPRTEEKKSEELVSDQRKAEEEERSSEDYEEAAMAAWSLFAHPCSLLQYVIRAWACRLGLHDSLGNPKPSAAPAAPANYSSTQEEGEEDTKTTTGFYIQEVITRVRAVRIRPSPPSNPREGSGGNGGQHH